MRRLAPALALVCGGCDTVFGLDEAVRACPMTSFASAKPTDIAEADTFSITWDLSTVVLVDNGLAYEVAMKNGKPTAPAAIDLGSYVDVMLSITPEGDMLYMTAEIEQPLLQAAVRSGAAWQLGAKVPVGTYAGTPSAASFGPRRQLVRLSDFGDVQEYEDQDGNGRWTAVGDPHAIDGPYAPNLTPNGLTMVYAGAVNGPSAGIYEATRPSTADWFGAPTQILAGPHEAPQLLDRCQQLYVVDDDITGIRELRRYAL